MDDWMWDECHAPMIVFEKTEEVRETDVGDEAQLEIGEYTFDVEIETIEDNGLYSGAVIRIGPGGLLEAEGIERGDEVTFLEEHIHRVWQKET